MCVPLIPQNSNACREMLKVDVCGAGLAGGSASLRSDASLCHVDPEERDASDSASDEPDSPADDGSASELQTDDMCSTTRGV